MCCFSRAVRFVGQTRIFARAAPGDRQLLAYAMNVELDDELAMVLPLPVPLHAPDDAVAFIDLEAYPRLFHDLEAAFPPVWGPQPLARAMSNAVAKEVPKLVVHDVGAFEASFVPRRADFARLDPRFRMPDRVWNRLPVYADWGFAVFRLKPSKGIFGGAKRQSVHPMAFSFPTREPGALFFPTVHVHDGTVPAHAQFDHMLFCQADGVLGSTLGWAPSSGALAAAVDVARAKGLVDGERGGFMTPLVGSLENRDTWLRAPAGVVVEDLNGAGKYHAFAIGAQHAYLDGGSDERFARWSDTARTKLAPLCRGVRAGLVALETANAARWRLAPLTDDLRPHFMNGDKLWSGTSYMNGSANVTPGPGRVTFTPFSDRVGPQSVTFGFAALPDEETTQEIRRELARLLDRAVS